MKRRCGDCEFYSTGYCLRMPPQVIWADVVRIGLNQYTAPGKHETRWPDVSKDNWCGEFKALSAPAAGGE